MIHIYGFVSMLFTLLMGGCNDMGVDPPIPPLEKKWEVVPELKEFDIWGFKEHNGVLYVTINQRSSVNGLYGGLIFNTNDGNNWSLFKVFDGYISPITFHGDTLVIADGDSLWNYHSDFGWKKICQLPYFGSDDVRDIFYLNNTLYIKAIRLWVLSDSGTFREIIYPQAGGKYLIHKVGDREIAYYRPWAFSSKFYWFDGENFFEMTEGLTESERNNSTVDAMWLKNDTLFAGFSNPPSIKYYAENKWNGFTDTLPHAKDAYMFRPVLETKPTVICFIDDTLYAGTNYIGILKWENNNREWKNFSEGLPKLDPSVDVYMGMNFLLSFKGYFYTGYGEPKFSPYFAPTGVYKYKIK